MTGPEAFVMFDMVLGIGFILFIIFGMIYLFFKEKKSEKEMIKKVKLFEKQKDI